MEAPCDIRGISLNDAGATVGTTVLIHHVHTSRIFSDKPLNVSGLRAGAV